MPFLLLQLPYIIGLDFQFKRVVFFLYVVLLDLGLMGGHNKVRN